MCNFQNMVYGFRSFHHHLDVISKDEGFSIPGLMPDGEPIWPARIYQRYLFRMLSHVISLISWKNNEKHVWNRFRIHVMPR
jgi:hypothetical protein